MMLPKKTRIKSIKIEAHSVRINYINQMDDEESSFHYALKGAGPNGVLTFDDFNQLLAASLSEVHTLGAW
jgi:hypothetical protein